MRRENGAVTGIKRFDFGFSEEECIWVHGLEMMMYWIDVGRKSTDVAEGDGEGFRCHVSCCS